MRNRKVINVGKSPGIKEANYLLILKHEMMAEILTPAYSGRDEFVCFLYQRHYRVLLVYAAGLCRRYGFDQSNAKDFVQGCFLEAMNNWEKVAKRYEQYGVGTLCRIMEFNALDGKRKQKSNRGLEEFFAAQNSGTYDHSLELQAEQYRNLFPQLLSEQDCEIMYLYLDGYSYEEIGEIVDMHASTVGVRIHRSKKILRKYLNL